MRNPALLSVLFCTVTLVAFLPAGECSLKSQFYQKTCPSFPQIVTGTVAQFLFQDATLAPALLRMHFHDCFVRGCDGSVLLNSTNGVPSEKSATSNLSLRRFDVIETIKARLEVVCPAVVSCADILATATRDAVLLVKPSGEPSSILNVSSAFPPQSSGVFWKVETGRRDGNVSLATEVNVPSPFESASSLIQKFVAKGLNPTEMVLLQGGGHSIGQGHCRFILGRLSNFNGSGSPDPTMNSSYVQTLQAACGGNPNVAVNQDPVTPVLLDKQYFQNVNNSMGLFTSDQEMLFDRKTQRAVLFYASAPNSQFMTDFGKAMTKMSKIGVLTGTQGSIRSVCALAN